MPLAEALIVGILVACSAVYATWKLLSPRWRLKLLDALAPAAAQRPGGMLARLRRNTQEQLLHGCGACARHQPPEARRSGPRTPPRPDADR